MVAGSRANSQLLTRVAEIYDWLDSQIRQEADLAGRCDACGKCCNFGGSVSQQEPASASEQGFDHVLFVTTAEVMYFGASLDAGNVKGMPGSRCPYNIGGKCSVYEHRFAGCRIFCCKGDTAFQSRLSELVLKRFKLLCTEFHIPYRYTDLATALNGLVSV